jgi:hypothetical protein
MRRICMRRLLLIAAGLAALTLSAPGAALASHGHHRHHKRRAHHAKVRFEHIGPTGTSTTGSGAGPGGGNPPATPSAPENAGKVASYTGGVLNLTLNDGSSVSGKVTNATRIECLSATTPPPGTGQDNGPGDDNGPSDDNGLGEENGPGDDNHGGNRQEGDQQPPVPGAGAPQAMGGTDGDDDGEAGQTPASEPPCDTSALIPGAVVRQAELRIGPSGTEFESIEVVR